MRKIIKIDQSLCNGCGDCITACAEGAIELKDGKAQVVSDSFCDGLGACLAVCPQGALTMEERDAPVFDEEAAKEHNQGTKADFSHEKIKPEQESANELCGWPIQMSLVRPWAPYLQGASLLVAGDCTAFAYPTIQQDFIKGRVALVGCPKLDDTESFVDKLSEVLKANDIRDINVLHMTVPCCSELETLVAEAVRRSGKDVPQKSHVVGIDGKLI
jgi:NAD-dependent dihydropyrimidine dehydrogenase PreA subunit